MDSKNNTYIVGAFLVLLISLVSAATGMMLINLIDDDSSPSYSITGTYSDESGSYDCYGTGTYKDLNESTLDYVYEFTYNITCESFNNELNSILIMSAETNLPELSLYEYLRNEIIGGTETSVWQTLDNSNGNFVYYISEGKILKVDIDAQGIKAEAVLNE